MAFDPGECQAYTASLSGDLIAMRAFWTEDDVKKPIVWTFTSDGPIFGTPAIDLTSSKICFATVQGTIATVDKEGKMADIPYFFATCFV